MDNSQNPADPVDVSILINFVYKSQDARVYPESWNCPYDLGDVNCDGFIDPVDVTVLANKVYKSLDEICLPCDWLLAQASAGRLVEK
jgi:hypothetical protein